MRFRMEGDALLDADRLTASNEAGRRADAILRQLRRRPMSTTAPQGSSPRIRHLAATMRHEYDSAFDLSHHADEDVALYGRILRVRGHVNDFARAERQWANGKTDVHPDMPAAA